jgi:hypothetical protein
VALTNEEIEQIRAVVRSEIANSQRGRWPLSFVGPKIFVLIFVAVLALHVLVIGGLTVYHVMTSGSN